MCDFLQFMLKATIIVEFVIGSLGNGFIAAVNIMDWVKRRKISAVDQILTALAVSRITFLWSLLIAFMVSVQDPSLPATGKMARINTVFWTVTNHFSIWLATCLSIFYFLKIANFSNLSFLRLKWRVKKVVSATLLASGFFLFLNIFIIDGHIHAWSARQEANVFNSIVSSNNAQLYRLILLTGTMFTFIPFTVTLVTFLLLIFSLWRHLKNMQHSTKGSRDVSTTAHIKALKMVVTFLFLYSWFFLSLFVQYFNSHLERRSPIILFLLALGFTFPSVHSCVLILDNRKMRQASLSVLWCLRCRFKDEK